MFLSHGGRLELVRTVIAGIKNLWAQPFTLPKKLIKRVDAMCRDGNSVISMRASLLKIKLCCPGVLEGWISRIWSYGIKMLY